MTTRTDILVTAERLSALLADDVPVRLLDVRWRLDRPDGRPDYLAAHLPGAVYVDLDTQLARHGEPSDGRHPLPAVDRLQRDVRSWGIDEDTRIVVYDDNGNLAAARAWWLLRHAGLASVRMLDGGLAAWTGAGLATEAGDVTVTAGTATLRYGRMPVLDIEAAADFPTRGTLLDARAPERYRGDTEPIDPRAGHIPGALNTPTGGNLDAAGRFLPAERLRERYLAAGVAPGSPVATYCGSGVTAAHNAAALMLAGFEPALYPGSWSQWSNTPDRPVATGAEPRGGVLPGE